MKTLDKAHDKVKNICDTLRKETLEPARREAEAILEEAKERAEKMILNAKEQAERIHALARADIEQERSVFHSSLEQGARQAIETLRQSIESKFFNEELEDLIKRESSEAGIVAKIIEAIVKAIEKDGVDANLEAVIPKSASPKEVAGLLGEGLLAKLKDNSISLGNFSGGAQVKLIGKRMTIDITDAALTELLARFVHKDLRKMIFAK